MVSKAGNKIELDSLDPELIRDVTDCGSKNTDRLLATCEIRNTIHSLFHSLLMGFC